MSKRLNNALTHARGGDIVWMRVVEGAAEDPVDIALDKLYRRLRLRFESGMRQQLFSEILANALGPI